MESLKDRVEGRRGGPLTRHRGHVWVVPLLTLFLFLALGSAHMCWSLQYYPLSQEGGAGSPPAVVNEPAQATAAPGHATPEAKPAATKPEVQQPAAAAHGAAAPQAGHEPSKAAEQKAAHGAPALPGTPAHEAAKTGPEAAAEHGAEAGGHGAAHGPALPEISPIPGVTFVETMIKLMEYELHGRFLGWRPNDIIVGPFTDNINNYQLGVLEALRFTSLRLKDSLTRMGDADTYDPDLEQAVNLLMNSATKFWFPSAESSYGEAMDHLKAFVEKLKTGKRSFYYRRDNLVLLLSTYKDLLGNVNKTLVASDVGWFKTDDYFYYAKGVAHVYSEILRVARVGYKTQLASTMYGTVMMDEVLHEFSRVEKIEPWLVLDADLGGFFANHRANLNAPLSEAAHLLGVLSQL